MNRRRLLQALAAIAALPMIPVKAWGKAAGPVGYASVWPVRIPVSKGDTITLKDGFGEYIGVATNSPKAGEMLEVELRLTPQEDR